MTFSHRTHLQAIFGNVIWLCLAGYFVYHMIIGARGIISLSILNREVEQLESEWDALKESNAFLNNKVQRIRSDNLDLDLLEEQAQKILGLTYPNNIVVLLPHNREGHWFGK